jgi:hypothetical protein
MREVGGQVGEVAERPVRFVVRVRRARDHQVVHVVRPEIEDAAPVLLVELPVVGQAEAAGLFRRQVQRCLDVGSTFAPPMRAMRRGRPKPRTLATVFRRGSAAGRCGGAGRRRIHAGQAVIAGQALAGIRDAGAAGQVGRALLGQGRIEYEECGKGEEIGTVSWTCFVILLS